MCYDINPILEGWNYASGELLVRTIEGEDSRPRIQIRMDMGLIQLEWMGRPDGKKPHDCVSLLDFYSDQMQGEEDSPKLSRQDCFDLGQEAIQYYWRRISFFELKEYKRAEEDAEHNLGILDLCYRFGEHEQDRQLAEQYRAFVMTHRIQAQALAFLDGEDYAGALEVVRVGIDEIEAILHLQGQFDKIEGSPERLFLLEWLKELGNKRPMSLRERLHVDLQRAVETEQFERAAVLRDRLRRLDAEQGDRLI